MREVLSSTDVKGEDVVALGIDTTGSVSFQWTRRYSRSTTTISGVITRPARGPADHRPGARENLERFIKEKLTFNGEDSPMSHRLLSVMGARPVGSICHFTRPVRRECVTRAPSHRIMFLVL